MSEANHNLNRLLDKPGSIIRKYLFGGVLNLSQEGVGCMEICF